MNKAERIADLLNRLNALGFSTAEAQRLRRISMTLNRWATAECNGEIQRDETTGKPSRVFQSRTPGNRPSSYLIPDRETGALKQLAAIMERHPSLWAFHQGDPRGVSLYVGRKTDLKTDANQIVAKAQSWGAELIEDEGGWHYLVNGEGNPFWGPHKTEEAAAIAYLKKRGATIPARDLLPLDQHYTRGLAVCV